MEWLANLSEIERKVILAATSHATLEFDFNLTAEEWESAEAAFQSVNSYIDGNEAVNLCANIPDQYRKPIWAALTAFVEDVHAPLDNLDNDEWTKMDVLHEALDNWDCDIAVKNSLSP